MVHRGLLHTFGLSRQPHGGFSFLSLHPIPLTAHESLPLLSLTCHSLHLVGPYPRYRLVHHATQGLSMRDVEPA